MCVKFYIVGFTKSFVACIVEDKKGWPPKFLVLCYCIDFIVPLILKKYFMIFKYLMICWISIAMLFVSDLYMNENGTFWFVLFYISLLQVGDNPIYF